MYTAIPDGCVLAAQATGKWAKTAKASNRPDHRKRGIVMSVTQWIKRSGEAMQNEKHLTQSDTLPENFDSLEEFWRF
jgi:hypothetical protein